MTAPKITIAVDDTGDDPLVTVEAIEEAVDAGLEAVHDDLQAHKTSTADALAGKVGDDDARLSDAREPTAHTHPISGVTGLQGALDNKTAVGHQHPISDVTGLSSALSDKVDDDDARLSDARTPTSHTHAIGDVTGLSDALDGKVTTGALKDVVDFGSVALLISTGSANAITGTIPAPLAMLTLGTGSHVAIRAPGTNTGPVTLAIPGHLGGAALPVRHADGTALAAGDLTAGQAYILVQFVSPDLHWRSISGGIMTAAQRAALDTLADDLATLQASFAAALDSLQQSKANSGHSHLIGHVTGLPEALDGKLDTTAAEALSVGQEPSPGHHPERFATAAGAGPRYTHGDTVHTPEGRALRITGPSQIVSVPRKPIGPQDVDEVRIRVLRPSTVVDPASDAVGMGVVCFDSSGNTIQTVWLGAVEGAGLATAGSMAGRRMRISRAPGLADVALPPTTRAYAVIVQTWGGAGSRLDVLDAERHAVLDGAVSFGGVPLNAWGTLAERDQYDDEDPGFLFADVESDWQLWLRDGPAGTWLGPQPVRGPVGPEQPYLPEMQDIVDGRRRTMTMVSIADLQPQYADNNMQPGQENAQLAYQQQLFEEIGRNWGDKAFGWLVHGDVVQRAAAGVSEINAAETGPHAFLPEGTLTPGDPYPWGYHIWFDQAWEYGRTAIARIWASAGNHDVDHRGILTSPRANRFSYFEEAFGKLHYHVLIGNIGFLFLSTETGTVGGQIPNTVFDWADDLLAGTSRDIKWHLSVHHPLADRTPVGSRVVIRDPIAVTQSMIDAQEADFALEQGFGEVTIDIGPYEAPSEILTEIWLGDTETGELLRNGVDYRYEAPEPDDPADDDDDGDAPDDPQLTVIHVRRPLELGQTITVRTVNSIRSSLDLPSTDRMNALLTKYQDRIYAYLYGHTGNMADETQDHTQWDADRGIWFVGHNLSIPGVTRPGLPVDPFGARPAIYNIMTWDVDANTCVVRRWNSDAEDWLSETHPQNGAADFTITYDGQIDLGDGDVTFDGRWSDGSAPIMRGHPEVIVMDVAQTPGRQERLDEPPNPDRPNRLHRNVGETLVYRRNVLKAVARWSPKAGDGISVEDWLPIRGTTKFGNQVSLILRGAASTLAFRENTVRARGANANATGIKTWSGLDNAGVMRDILSLHGRYNTIVSHGRVGEPIQTTGRVDEGHVLLLCKAAEPGVRLDGRLTGARRPSTTTVNTSQFWLDIQHGVGANGSFTTRWQSSEGHATNRIVPVYCTLAGDPDDTLYLGLLNPVSHVGSPLRFSSANFWGERPQDEPLAWRIVRPVGWTAPPPKNLITGSEGFECWDRSNVDVVVTPLGDGFSRVEGEGTQILTAKQETPENTPASLSLYFRQQGIYTGNLTIRTADGSPSAFVTVAVGDPAAGTPPGITSSGTDGADISVGLERVGTTDEWRMWITHDGTEGRNFVVVIEDTSGAPLEIGKAQAEVVASHTDGPTAYEPRDCLGEDGLTDPEVEPENPDDDPFDPADILVAASIASADAHENNRNVRHRFGSQVVAPALSGPKHNIGAAVNEHGVAEVNAAYGPLAVGEGDILLLAPIKPNTVLRGQIRSHRRPGTTTTANSSSYTLDIDCVVGTDGSVRVFDVLRQLDTRDRMRLVQCRVDGVEYIGLQSTSDNTGAPLSNARILFTGTRTPDPRGFSRVSLGDLDQWTAEDAPVAGVYAGLDTDDPVVDALVHADWYANRMHRVGGQDIMTVQTVLPGPFADDAAAEAEGVGVGALYRVTGGSIAWRQT